MPFKLRDIGINTIEDIRRIPNDREYVGVIRERSFTEIENLSIDKDKITIDTSELMPGDIIFHTHYSDAQPGYFSDTDIRTSLLLGYPILLYHSTLRLWDYYDPKYPHPDPLNLQDVLWEDSYSRLKYRPVRCDCYSFARNFRQGVFGLPMKDLYSENPEPAYWYPKFADVESLGFVKQEKSIQDIKAGDILLVNVSPTMPYHVIIATTNTRGMHQLNRHSSYCYIPDFESNLLGIYDFQENNSVD
jgi:hypothetical protein